MEGPPPTSVSPRPPHKRGRLQSTPGRGLQTHRHPRSGKHGEATGRGGERPVRKSSTGLGPCSVGSERLNDQEVCGILGGTKTSKCILGRSRAQGVPGIEVGGPGHLLLRVSPVTLWDWGTGWALKRSLHPASPPGPHPSSACPHLPKPLGGPSAPVAPPPPFHPVSSSLTPLSLPIPPICTRVCSPLTLAGHWGSQCDSLCPTLSHLEVQSWPWLPQGGRGTTPIPPGQPQPDHSGLDLDLDLGLSPILL